MNHNTLQLFNQQLCQWLELRLASGTYPFRRVESLHRLPCADGAWPEGLVLWINRASLLAGALVLLPKQSNAAFLQQAGEMCRAFGLVRFVAWEARQIVLHQMVGEQYTQLETIPLPPATKAAPTDFANALDRLLKLLKDTCIDAALPARELPADYFANLCRLTADDLEPSMASAARLAAGADKSDNWALNSPPEKIWLSLWRLLFLLWNDRLPPGIQPERLEQAMRYALADLIPAGSDPLLASADEFSMPVAAAVRLHQLGGRLQQLGWRNDRQRAKESIRQLLQAVASVYELPEAVPPWPAEPINLAINTRAPATAECTHLVGPPAYLGGVSLQAHLFGRPHPLRLAHRCTELPADCSGLSVFANLLEAAPPSRSDQERLLLELRRSWPNRRFQPPRQAPGWQWQALYLSGLATSASHFHLHLPGDWMSAPGADLLWELLTSHFQLVALGQDADDGCLMAWSPAGSATEPLRIYRGDGVHVLPAEFLAQQPAILLRICLETPAGVLDLLCRNELQIIKPPDWPAAIKGLETAVYLYIHTTLGSRLWSLLGNAKLAEMPAAMTTFSACGLPLPAPARLATLAKCAWHPGQPLPPIGRLDRLLGLQSGPEAELPTMEMTGGHTDTVAAADRNLKHRIQAEVFRDGIPRFPEHYLMKHFRPQLQSYAIPGPLREGGTFFDRIQLHGPGEAVLEVTGATTAEALVLASRCGRKQVELPCDELITEQLLNDYRQELNTLWERLTRVCRLHVPRQQAALNLARRIWREQSLPPWGA